MNIFNLRVIKFQVRFYYAPDVGWVNPYTHHVFFAQSPL